MTTVEELATEVATLKTHVPTLDELVRDIGIQAWNGSASWTSPVTVTLFTALAACRIRAVSLVTEYGSVPASDLSYWTATLRKGSLANGWQSIAARSTRSTGPTANGGISSRVPWTFDAAAFNDVVLTPSDLLQIVWSKTGSPPPIDFPAVISTAYVPA